MNLQLGKHLRPGGGDLVVHDRDRHQTRVHHLGDVVVEQVWIGRNPLHRGFAGLGQRLVQFTELVPDGGILPDVDFLPGEVVDFGDWRRSRTRHDDPCGLRDERRGVVDLRLMLARHDQRAREIPVAFGELGEHLFASYGDEERADPQVSRLELLVELLLELAAHIVHGALHLAAIEKEAERRRHHEDAEHAALGDAVEIPLPLLAVEPGLEPRGGLGLLWLDRERGGAEIQHRRCDGDCASHPRT
jgi:hypothetical protein